jgi:transcriptional regulator with XRE-family HTH domain
VRPPYAEFAEHMVALRKAARFSQRDLAAAASVSRGTVQDAESGTRAPSPALLDALVRACRAAPESQTRAHVLRDRGRTALRDRLRGLEAPAPALIHTKDDLGAALAAAYERAGAPAPSDLIRPAGGGPGIPRTTAWRIIRRKGLPADAKQLQTFLDVCRVRRADQRHYHEAFQRIRAARGNRPAPPTPHRHGLSADTSRRGIYKITPWFRDLMDNMTPEEIETALTFGTAYLMAGEARRNGTAPPRSLDDIGKIAREVFVAANVRGPLPDTVAYTGDETIVVEAKSSRPVPLPRGRVLPLSHRAAGLQLPRPRAAGEKRTVISPKPSRQHGATGRARP